ITGNVFFNNLGLTNQEPGTVTVASRSRRTNRLINGYKIKFVPSVAEITEQNVYLLQLLDSIRNLRYIPDTSVDKAILLIAAEINKLSMNKRELMITLALKYNAATRAVLGCILQQYCPKTSVEMLQQS